MSIQQLDTLKSVDVRRYYIDRVLFEIVKLAKGREIAFINKEKGVRGIKAHAIDFLKQNMAVYNFFNTPFNIYHSLARLENMPMFSFALGLRLKQQKDFNANFAQYFKGIDLGLDFDEKCIYDEEHTFCHKCNKSISLSVCEHCPDFKSNNYILYREVARTKRLFDDYKVAYSLKFSGSGFHINIEWPIFQDSISIAKAKLGKKVEDETAFFSWFLCELSEINNLTSLDKSVVSMRRVWKMPYSLDIKTGRIALPLSDGQFADFNLDLVKPDNVIETIRDRGLLTREGTNQDFNEFIQNFLMG